MFNAKHITINPNQELPGLWARKIDQVYLPGEEILVYDPGGMNIELVISVRTSANFWDDKELFETLWNVIILEVLRYQDEIDSSDYDDYCS